MMTSYFFQNLFFQKQKDGSVIRALSVSFDVDRTDDFVEDIEDLSRCNIDFHLRFFIVHIIAFLLCLLEKLVFFKVHQKNKNHNFLLENQILEKLSKFKKSFKFKTKETSKIHKLKFLKISKKIFKNTN